MFQNQVKVAVRIQPETNRNPGEDTQSTVRIENNQILLSCPDYLQPGDGIGSREFTHDYYFSPETYFNCTGQEDFFHGLEEDVLKNVSQGYNVCIMSYKQKALGDSLSMLGTDGQSGLIPRICSSLLDSGSKAFRVEVSYMKISNDVITDLLCPKGLQKKIKIGHDGVVAASVEGLSQYAVRSYDTIKLLMASGSDNESPRNGASRPSHTVFTITVTVSESPPTSESGDLLSKVILVDLADEETSWNEGEYGKVGNNLTTLESVVNSLAEGTSQKGKCKCVPYEDSVLTRILQESLGGNCRTLLLATITPAIDRYQGAQHTLQFAERAQWIINRSVINKKTEIMLREAEDFSEHLQRYNNFFKEMTCPWDAKLCKTEAALQKRQGTQLCTTQGTSEVSSGNVIINVTTTVPTSRARNQPASQDEDNVNNQPQGLSTLGTYRDDTYTETLEEETPECKDDTRISSTVKGFTQSHHGSPACQAEGDPTSKASKDEPDLPNSSHQTNTDRGAQSNEGTEANLGILFWDINTNTQWLSDKLIKMSVTKISFKPLAAYNDNTWKSLSEDFSHLIFYHSMQSEKPIQDLSVYLQHFTKTHDCRNLIVVIGDLKYNDSESEMRSKWSQLQYCSYELVIFTEMELDFLCRSYKPHMEEIRGMIAKQTHLRSILDKSKVIKSRHSSSSQTHPKHVIGIFSRCGETHYNWLKTLLQSESFKSSVKEIRPFYISNSNQEQFRQEVSQCSFGILYHSRNHGRINLTDIADALYNDELKYLHDEYGKEKVLVVIDDLEDSSQEEKSRILQNQFSIGIYAQEQILFSGGEKASNYASYQPSELNKTTQEKLNKIESTMTKRDTEIKSTENNSNGSNDHSSMTDNGTSCQMGTNPIEGPVISVEPGKSDSQSIGKQPSETNTKTNQGLKNPCSKIEKRHIIGIFSRCAQDNYDWLQVQLKCSTFNSHVKDIRAHYISNNGLMKFREEVSKCTFGIIYHTRKHGRLNVTNVTDSLYDDELAHLSKKLGKKNVIVVLDDLDNSSSLEKTRILDLQPSIRSLANDLILFSEREKQSINKNEITPEIREKLERIKQLAHDPLHAAPSAR